MSVSPKLLSVLMIFVALFYFGCSPKEPEMSESIPPDIISQDSMIAIMTDCYLAEGAIKQVQVEHRNVAAHTHSYYRVIFEKYNTTYEKYKESLRYYYQYPEIAEMMYDKVLENLAILESEIKSGKEEDSPQNQD